MGQSYGQLIGWTKSDQSKWYLVHRVKRGKAADATLHLLPSGEYRVYVLGRSTLFYRPRYVGLAHGMGKTIPEAITAAWQDCHDIFHTNWKCRPAKAQNSDLQAVLKAIMQLEQEVLNPDGKRLLQSRTTEELDAQAALVGESGDRDRDGSCAPVGC